MVTRHYADLSLALYMIAPAIKGKAAIFHRCMIETDTCTNEVIQPNKYALSGTRAYLPFGTATIVLETSASSYRFMARNSVRRLGVVVSHYMNVFLGYICCNLRNNLERGS